MNSNHTSVQYSMVDLGMKDSEKIIKDKMRLLKFQDCFGCKHKMFIHSCNNIKYDYYYYNCALKQLVKEGEM